MPVFHSGGDHGCLGTLLKCLQKLYKTGFGHGDIRIGDEHMGSLIVVHRITDPQIIARAIAAICFCTDHGHLIICQRMQAF